MAKRAGEEDEEVTEPKVVPAKAVTGRPNDLGYVVPEPALPNSTMASRAKKRVTQDKRVKAETVESK